MRLCAKTSSLLLGTGLLAVVFGTLGTGVASADIIFNNLGSGDSYDTTSGHTISGPGTGSFASVGEPFIPASTSTLSDISLPLGISSGTNSVVVDLTNDASDLPGTTLETWTISSLTGGMGSVQTVTDALDLTLSSGQRYWVAVANGGNNTNATWFNAFNDPIGPFAVDTGSGFGPTRGILPGLKVEGASAVSVPEPPALALIGSIVPGVLWLARSRRRLAAASRPRG